MATVFKRAAALAGNTRTTVYTCPGSGVLNTIVFSGTAANIDTTNKVDHWVTLEVGTGSPAAVLVQVPVPWGGSIKFPKLNVAPGESVYVTADTNLTGIQANISLVERS